MVLSSTIQSTLLRHRHSIDTALRATLEQIARVSGTSTLDTYYGLMQYHLGWVDTTFTPTRSNPGKLLRPTLLLLAYEAAGAWGLAEGVTTGSTDYLQRALPAAISVELTHNFTLIHDDIEDGDTERRHRPTMWKVWGAPQAINAGDGMFALARLALWDCIDEGVDATLAAQLAAILDRNILTISEGQYLDISFESRQDISVAMYVDMITRKTAVLMGCAARMGALLGTRDQKIIERLTNFGNAIGTAFQVRDDLLGVWATSAESGKTPAGDVYRRKKSLPILHAMEQANPEDAQLLRNIYQQDKALTSEQVKQVLNIFEHTNTQFYCQQFLRHHCQLAQEALDNIPRPTNPISIRALEDMEAMLQFIADAAN